MYGRGFYRNFFIKNQKVETHYIVTRRAVSTFKGVHSSYDVVL